MPMCSMMGSVALSERPVAIITSCPAATTAWAASRTVTDMWPSWSTRVPSTSRAIIIFSFASRWSSLPATEASVIVVIPQVEQTPPTLARTRATAPREALVNSARRRPAAFGLGTGRLEDGEHRHAAEVLLQRCRDVDRAVRVLVVLQEGDDPAGRGEGAVQGGNRAGALGRTVLVEHAFADVEPARLEGGAVRGRGQLAVGALGGDPGFAVKLAGSGIAEVPRGRVDHAIGQLALGQHLLFPGQQARVFGGGLLDRGVDEHLHLVELVHADDAAGVLAVRTGLAAVAGALPGVADRAAREVQDFVRVVAGQGHLGGAHQVQVVLREAVDFGVVLDVESGALHGFRADQRRGDHGDEAGVDGLLHGHLEQRHLQPGAHAAQEVEA